MKSLITIITLVLITACGASADRLATSIDKASEAAKEKDKSDDKATTETSSNTDGTTVTVETKVTVTVGGKAVDTDNQSDELDGTAWSTDCDNGITYTARFAKGVETLTTNVYPDAACKMVPKQYNQRLNYAIDGDMIQFNIGKPGEFKNGHPYQTFEIDGNLLRMSGNLDEVMTRI